MNGPQDLSQGIQTGAKHSSASDVDSQNKQRRRPEE